MGRLHFAQAQSRIVRTPTGLVPGAVSIVFGGCAVYAPRRERLPFMSNDPTVHRAPFWAMVWVCLVLLALRLADLAFFTDLHTGFVTALPYWPRIALPLAGAAASYVLSRTAASTPRGLLFACPPLGVCLLATAAALGVCAWLLCDPLAWAAGGFAVPAQDLPRFLGAAAAVFSALWLLGFGVRCFSPLADPPRRPLPCLAALPMTFFFLWLIIYRVAVAPASVMRLGCTLQMLSAAGALLFTAALLRVFLTPGLAIGRGVFATGMNAFLLCTCHELPQTAAAYAAGAADARELAIAAVMALLGVAGLVCAWQATGTNLARHPV